MKRIRCPIHNYIALDASILPIVDFPEFQRLRRIKQLGMAYLVYPGAQHSRFEHSLGVYHLGGVVSDILNLGEYEKKLITLSGLLHDIGHGPFSHIMETVSQRTHEERSAEIILKSDISRKLEIIDVDPVMVAETIMGRARFSPIISSEIDIDRMDYLLRDAHYSGVSTGLDAGRLTAVMELYEDQLVFREAGLGAVEALLIARFMMYPYVYYHHTARVAERMISRAIFLLMELGSLEEEELWCMDDISLMSVLRGSTSLPKQLVTRIDERRLYKRGWEISLSQLPKHLDSDLKSFHMLKRLKEHLSRETVLRIEEDIAHELDIYPELVILDCPFPPVLRTREIMIRKRKGNVVSARSISQLISILEKAQLDHLKIRIYVPQEIIEKASLLLEKTVPALLSF